MSPLSIRRRMARLRGSFVAVACTLTLSGAVIAHHSDMPMAGQAGMDMHGVATMVMCLGVMGVAILAAAALPALRRIPALRAPRRLHPRELMRGKVGAHPTRAGPPLFLVLAVLRR